MGMIAHQAPSENHSLAALYRQRQTFAEVAVILIVFEQVLLVNATDYNMIDTCSAYTSWSSWHEKSFAGARCPSRLLSDMMRRNNQSSWLSK
jgi:hypothetical protein